MRAALEKGETKTTKALPPALKKLFSHQQGYKDTASIKSLILPPNLGKLIGIIVLNTAPPEKERDDIVSEKRNPAACLSQNR